MTHPIQPAASPSHPIDSVVFDLGKVLLDWDPRYYYRRHFSGNETGMEDFLRQIVPGSWVLEMDRGKASALCIAERQQLHPQHAELIGLWSEGWRHMLKGEIAGTAALIAELKAAGLRLYALTNFSTETFPVAQQICPTLALFEDVVVSGAIGMVKPEPAIYAYTQQRCGFDPARAVFIDDMAENVAAARDAGWHALRFQSPEQLRQDLRQLGVLA